ADQAALTTKLRPEPADYDAVFTPDAAQTVKTALDAAWDGGSMVLKPLPEQSDIDVSGATTDQLQKGEGNALACPSGYKGFADKLQAKTVVYCAHFKKPGENAGLSVDALVYVNGHWALFPKPFRALK